MKMCIKFVPHLHFLHQKGINLAYIVVKPASALCLVGKITSEVLIIHRPHNEIPINCLLFSGSLQMHTVE